MNRTMTALFPDRHAANRAKDRLIAGGVEADRVRLQREDGASADKPDPGHDLGVFFSKLLMPARDRRMFEAGIGRGAVLLVAEVEEDEADAALAALGDSDAIDLDAHEEEWLAATEGRGPDETYGAGAAAKDALAENGAAPTPPDQPGAGLTRTPSELDGILARERPGPDDALEDDSAETAPEPDTRPGAQVMAHQDPKADQTRRFPRARLYSMGAD